VHQIAQEATRVSRFKLAIDSAQRDGKQIESG